MQKHCLLLRRFRFQKKIAKFNILDHFPAVSLHFEVVRTWYFGIWVLNNSKFVGGHSNWGHSKFVSNNYLHFSTHSKFQTAAIYFYIYIDIYICIYVYFYIYIYISIYGCCHEVRALSLSKQLEKHLEITLRIFLSGVKLSLPGLSTIWFPK